MVMSSARDQIHSSAPGNTIAGAAYPGLSRAVWLQMLVLDGLLYLTLFWRDYSEPWQWVVAHYISFVAISDLAALFLPAGRRHWFNLFRLTSGLSFLILVVALACKNLGGAGPLFTALCASLCVLRMLHAGWCWRRFGPGIAALKALPAQASEYFKRGDRSQRWGCAYLLIGLGLLYFPQLAYWTHYNWGEHRLDDILTGLQAQAGLNFCIKLFVFELLITGAGSRLAMRSVVAGLFLLQWPLMLAMFYLAPLPVIHGVVEVYELCLVWLGYQYWRRSGLAKPASPA